jgi:hypothetical protein
MRIFGFLSVEFGFGFFAEAESLLSRDESPTPDMAEY